MQEQGVLRRKGARARTWVEATQGKPGVQPTVPSFLHFSAARMISRLQSRLNTSNDPSGRALLATLHPTDSTEGDLTSWVGSIVVLHHGVSGRSGYFKRDQITECCVVSALFLLKNWMVVVTNHSFRICKLASEQH